MGIHYEPEGSPSPARHDRSPNLMCCPDCGRDVSRLARACVHCGRPRPGRTSCGFLRTAVTVLAIGAVVAIGLSVVSPCRELRAMKVRHMRDRAWVQALQERPEGCGFLGVALRSPCTVVHVAPGSPAEQAGLRRGDTFAAADGQPLTHWRDYLRLAWTKKPGEPLNLTVARLSELVPIEATLAVHPDD